MKPAIDSYCYHRHFGEIYAGIESDPGTRITLDDFLVRAHTLPEPTASTRVLAKCGFHFVGDIVDPDYGPIWRWESEP